MSLTSAIFHADDNADDRLCLKRVLSKLRPQASYAFASDGVAAKAFLEDFVFHEHACIFVDLDMPGLHGLDLIAWLNGHCPAWIPQTIILSSSVEPKNLLRARQLGCRAFLEKQNRLDVLEKLIGSVLLEVEDRSHREPLRLEENLLRQKL